MRWWIRLVIRYWLDLIWSYLINLQSWLKTNCQPDSARLDINCCDFRLSGPAPQSRVYMWEVVGWYNRYPSQSFDSSVTRSQANSFLVPTRQDCLWATQDRPSFHSYWLFWLPKSYFPLFNPTFHRRVFGLPEPHPVEKFGLQLVEEYLWFGNTSKVCCLIT